MGSELFGPVLRCRRRAEGVWLVCGAEGEKSATGGKRATRGKFVCLVYLVYLVYLVERTNQAKETRQTSKS